MRTGISPQKVAVGVLAKPLQIIINISLAFYITPLMIHHMGNRTYGFWVLAGTIVNYYMMMDLNLSTAVTRYISQALGRGNQRLIQEILGTAFRIYFLIGSVILLITAIVYFNINFFITDKSDHHIFGTVVMIMGSAACVNFINKTFYGAISSYLRFDLLFYCAFTSTIIRAILVIIFIKLGYGIITISFITLFTSTYNFVFNIISFNRVTKFNFKALFTFNRTYFIKIINYSKNAAVGIIADILRFEIDTILISFYLGLSSVTHYNIGSTIARYFTDIIRSSASVLTPIFSQLHGENNHEKTKNIFMVSLKMTSIVALYIGGGIVLYGFPFIETWVGLDYSNAYNVLLILTIGIIISMSQAPGVRLLFAYNKHRYYSMYNGLEGILNLFLSVVLIHRYGIIGVALGTSISMIIIRLCIHPYFVCKIIKIQAKTYYGYYLPIIVKGVLIIIAYYFLFKNKPQANYIWIIKNASLYSLFFFSVVTMSILTRSERSYLSNRLRHHFKTR